MLKRLSSKTLVIVSGITTLLMFVIIMFIVDPLIDGKNGLGVISLQLAFDKAAGVQIVNGWGEGGVLNFKKYIFADYLYALSYALFFASLLSLLIFRAKQERHIRYVWVVCLALVAGVCDWIENTMEICFVNDMAAFSDGVFYIHSIIAVLKWMALPVVIVYIIALLNKSGQNRAV